MENNNQPLTWSFFNLWNKALETRADRPLVKREKMWASELGGAYVDRYLKMKAVPPSNPPNPRSLRKFEAGNIWEYIAEYVLKRSGILIDNSGEIIFQ
jgi:hypothetical protein